MTTKPTKPPIEAAERRDGGQENPGHTLTVPDGRALPPQEPDARTSESGVQKSALKTVPGRPFQPGYDPRRGHGPAPGAPNAGRPRDEFKEWLEGVSVNDPKVRERIVAILQHSEPKTFLKILRWADERLNGKPGQSVDLNIEGKPTLLLGPLPQADESEA